MIWNALEATTNNCVNCQAWEDAPGTGEIDALSVILHETGHCGIGLGHPNLTLDLADQAGQIDGLPNGTSFTASVGNSTAREWCTGPQPAPLYAEELCPGNDEVRGSSDDTQTIEPGSIPDSIHWFRIADNNPALVDGLVIDKDSYSRSVTSNIPSGHTWAANANYRVPMELGLGSTHSVMYSAIGPGQKLTGLSADDVAMAKMGMAGADRIAGTGDDYKIHLRYVAACSDTDLIVSFDSSMGPGDGAGACAVITEESFPQGLTKIHHSISDPGPLPPTAIDINPNSNWNFGSDLFLDGFENGDAEAWPSVVL